MSKNELAEVKEKTLSNYMRNDGIMKRFEYAVGESLAASYVSSVLLLVKYSEDLQKCSYESICMSALRAGALRLSVDPAKKQAYLVPFGNKKTGIKEATLIVGWKGLYDMAIRTGQYISIHDHKVDPGLTVIFDPFTGLPEIVGDEKSPGGWAWTLIMTSGFRKTVYWSMDDIHAHRDKYNPYWKTSFGWKYSPEAMEKKTPLRYLLMNFGNFDEKEKAIIEAIETGADSETIDALLPSGSDQGDAITTTYVSVEEKKEDSRNWPPGIAHGLISDGIFENEESVLSALSLCDIEDTNQINDACRWGRHFMGLIDENFTAPKAAEIANNRYRKALLDRNEEKPKEGIKVNWPAEKLDKIVATGLAKDKLEAHDLVTLQDCVLWTNDESSIIYKWILDHKSALKTMSEEDAIRKANEEYKIAKIKARKS